MLYTSSTGCEHVTDLTEAQRNAVNSLERMCVTVLQHLLKKYPHTAEWKLLAKWWNGKLYVGGDDMIASFDASSGCLLAGIPKDGGRLEILRAKVLLALSKGATNGKMCLHDLHNTVLKEAALLGFKFELPCGDVLEHGLVDSWGKSASCHEYRLAWPEFVGLHVSQVVDAFQKAGRRVEVYTWDSMHGKPAAPHIVRVIYDAKSGRVVSPAPHVGTVHVPEQTDNCFVQADDCAACIGAPLAYPPPEWAQYVGKLFTEVVDSLRMQYPHATIEAIPSIASLPKDMRRDRIRVRFDPDTARVMSVPTIG